MFRQSVYIDQVLEHAEAILPIFVPVTGIHPYTKQNLGGGSQVQHPAMVELMLLSAYDLHRHIILGPHCLMTHASTLTACPSIPLKYTSGVLEILLHRHTRNFS